VMLRSYGFGEGVQAHRNEAATSFRQVARGVKMKDSAT
jgi:hypothetical protein